MGRPRKIIGVCRFCDRPATERVQYVTAMWYSVVLCGRCCRRAITSGTYRQCRPPSDTQRVDGPDDRDCLGGCGRKFWSDWSGDRICPACARRQHIHIQTLESRAIRGT